MFGPGAMKNAEILPAQTRSQHQVRRNLPSVRDEKSRFVVMVMPRETRRPERRIQILPWQMTLGVQGDLIQLQHSIDKSLRISELRVCDLSSDPKSKILAKMHKLPAKPQGVSSSRVGYCLKKLVTVGGPISGRTSAREGCCFVLNIKIRQQRFGHRISIATKAIWIARHPVVRNTSLCRKSRRPGVD